MTLVLRLKAKAAPTTIQKVYLDADFYTLHDMITMLDECMYEEVNGCFLTRDQEAFDFDPRHFVAVAVVEER